MSEYKIPTGWVNQFAIDERRFPVPRQPKFAIGDVVRKISLCSKNMFMTGGFFWDNTSKATVVGYYPHGTRWGAQQLTGPHTYMIQYQVPEHWKGEFTINNRIYPAYEDQLRLA